MRAIIDAMRDSDHKGKIKVRLMNYGPKDITLTTTFSKVGEARLVAWAYIEAGWRGIGVNDVMIYEGEPSDWDKPGTRKFALIP